MKCDYGMCCVPTCWLVLLGVTIFQLWVREALHFMICGGILGLFTSFRVISPEAEAVAAMEEITGPLFTMQFSFYNYTNLDAIKTGATPSVTEVGPYSVAVSLQKYDIVFSEDNTVVSYKTFMAFEEQEDPPLTDSVTGPFVDYNYYVDEVAGSESALATHFGITPSEMSEAVSRSSNGAGGVFTTMTVKEWLFNQTHNELAVLDRGSAKGTGILGGHGEGGFATPAEEEEYLGFSWGSASYYTGMDDPSKGSQVSQLSLSKHNASALFDGGGFWNSDQVIDAIPDTPSFPLPYIATVDGTNHMGINRGYSLTVFGPLVNTIWLQPAFDAESTLEFYDASSCRVKTWNFAAKFQYFRTVASHIFTYRYVLSADYYKIDPEFFNDKEGLQNLLWVRPGLYSYNAHLCSQDSGEQMTQYVSVDGYPACNASVDNQWVDTMPLLALTFGFNLKTEMGMFVKAKVDGDYAGAALDNVLLPAFSVNIGGYGDFNRTLVVYEFFGFFLDHIMSSGPVDSGHYAVVFYAMLVIGILAPVYWFMRCVKGKSL